MTKYKWIIGGIGLAYASFGALVFRNVQRPNTYTHEEAFELDKKQGSYTESIRGIQKQVVRIPSTMGYYLYAHWLANGDSNKTIILVHGITSNIYGAMKYYALYHEMGFNILVYDHRNHGKSGGVGTSLGYHEKHDLEVCVQWVKEHVGQDSQVGTHGESMGGAIVIQHAAAYRSVDFVVADCPFADLARELRDVSRRDHQLAMWLSIPVASLISKLTGNGCYSESSPIKVIGRIEIPLMIIHGDSDTYITPDHAQDLYEAKVKGVRRLYFAQGADHALSIIKDRENYTREVKKFLEGIEEDEG